MLLPHRTRTELERSASSTSFSAGEIATGFSDGGVAICKTNFELRHEAAIFNPQHIHDVGLTNTAITAIDFAGPYLVCGDHNGSVTVLDKTLRTGKTFFKLESPKIQQLLAAERDSKLHILTLDSKGVVKRAISNKLPVEKFQYLTFSGRKDVKQNVLSISTNFDQSAILYGTRDGLITMIDYDGIDGEKETLISEELSAVKHVKLRGSDECAGVTREEDTITVFEKSNDENGECKWDLSDRFSHFACRGVTCVDFNSEILVASEGTSDIFVWKRIKRRQSDSANAPSMRVLTGQEGTVEWLHLTPTSLISRWTKNGKTFLDIRDAKSSYVDCSDTFDAGDGINCMSVNDDYIICGLLNKSILILETRSLKFVAKIEDACEDHIWSVKQNKNLFVSGSWQGVVKVWSKKDWSEISR